MPLSKKDKQAVSEAVDGLMDFYMAYCRMVQLGHDHPENVKWREQFGEHYQDWLAQKVREYKAKLEEHGIELAHIQAY